VIRRIHLESDAGTLSSCLFPKRAAQNRFILVIDDSPTVRKIIEVCLSRKGFEVESYPDGIEALRTFTNDPQKRIPHLVIVDIDLPRMNGYEIARFLRAKPQWKQTVIVMLSRHTGILEQLKARLAGTQAYITKPFTTEMITEVVIRLLGLSSVSIEG
jgi:twitching motility two-component system response regulator PilG